MSTFQVYKFTNDIRDGRYLTANSDGSMRWTLTRGDAHKLSRKEADTMAAWIRKVFIGHMALVVPENREPWDVLRAKPRGTKLNPKKRRKRASPAQLAARAKFTAMVKSGRKFGRKVARKARKVGRKSVAAAKAFRRTNPAAGRFQLAALCRGTVCYLAGLGLSSNRATASNFGTLSAARRSATQVKQHGAALGVTKVAIVSAGDSPVGIKRFLLGEA